MYSGLLTTVTSSSRSDKLDDIIRKDFPKGKVELKFEEEELERNQGKFDLRQSSARQDCRSRGQFS